MRCHSLSVSDHAFLADTRRGDDLIPERHLADSVVYENGQNALRGG